MWFIKGNKILSFTNENMKRNAYVTFKNMYDVVQTTATVSARKLVFWKGIVDPNKLDLLFR